MINKFLDLELYYKHILNLFAVDKIKDLTKQGGELLKDDIGIYKNKYYKAKKTIATPTIPTEEDFEPLFIGGDKGFKVLKELDLIT